MRFPESVRSNALYAIAVLQCGGWHPKVKRLKGFSDVVVEIVLAHRSGAYRVVLLVEAAVLVILHCFQKKSHAGPTTPRRDNDMIVTRYQHAKHIIGELT